LKDKPVKASFFQDFLSCLLKLEVVLKFVYKVLKALLLSKLAASRQAQN